MTLPDSFQNTAEFLRFPRIDLFVSVTWTIGVDICFGNLGRAVVGGSD